MMILLAHDPKHVFWYFDVDHFITPIIPQPSIVSDPHSGHQAPGGHSQDDGGPPATVSPSSYGHIRSVFNRTEKLSSNSLPFFLRHFRPILKVPIQLIPLYK